MSLVLGKAESPKYDRRETPRLWKEWAVPALLGWASLFGLTCDTDVEG